MCMKKLQNYVMVCYKSILINTWIFQKIKKVSWVINMILLIWFLKHIIMTSGLKMKSRLIKQNWLIEKNGLIKKSVDVSGTPPLEGDEEVKEGKRLKILTPNKLLTRFPILLAQIKAGNNSYELKNETRQILHLLYQYNKITKKVCNNSVK